MGGDGEVGGQPGAEGSGVVRFVRGGPRPGRREQGDVKRGDGRSFAQCGGRGKPQTLKACKHAVLESIANKAKKDATSLNAAAEEGRKRSVEACPKVWHYHREALLMTWCKS